MMRSISEDEQRDQLEYLHNLHKELDELGIKVLRDENDFDKPWGGYFVIDSESLDLFVETFFNDLDKDEMFRYGKNLRPKILVVAPGHQLSWQKHTRRSEVWKVWKGPVGIRSGETDTIPEESEILQKGELVIFKPGTRHRLIGLDTWGVVPEIWQHLDPNYLSDEADIIRIHDDYARN